MEIEFTAHNIRLDDGSYTKPEVGFDMSEHLWCASAMRTLNTLFPGPKSSYRVADLGCLEGGYSVEFARMGFQVLGLEVRESNLAACRYVKERTHLPNLEFVQDDAWNLENYGAFDAVFCCGLLYHLEHPKRFLEMLSRVTSRALILQTHFSTESPNSKFNLSPLDWNEGLQGRWYPEFENGDACREDLKWASWENQRSFWIRREHLLQAIKDIGFDIVMEQLDSLGEWIQGSMIEGYYKTDERGTFVGIKTAVREAVA